MNDMETVAVLAIITNCYPQWNPPMVTLELYSRAMNDLDFDTVNKVVEKYVMNNKFPPTIADIREGSAALLGFTPSLASDAWEEVQEQIREVGLYGVPTFSDDETTGAIRRTMKTIGWRNLCMSTNQDTLRAHFLKVHNERRPAMQQEILSSRGLRSGSPLATLAESLLPALEQ